LKNTHPIIAMQHTASRPAVVAAVNDLVFGSRIRAAGDQAGIAVTFVRSAADLVARAAGARLVLLDLDTRWLDAPTAIAALRADPVTADVAIVAFGPHVDGAGLDAARSAGADRVLARSGFVRVLPGLLEALHGDQDST
jgi:CheY-like chemotaxis protein